MAFRSAADKALALDFPPLMPPNLPEAIAAGFLPAFGSLSDVPSMCSPMACSTTSRAICMKSRLSPERFAMFTLSLALG